MQKYIVGLIALLSPIAIANAQSDSICKSSSISMPATTPSEQFSFEGNELIIDNKTGLMWQRCTYGFAWSSGDFSCSDTNNSIYTWREALDEVAQLNNVGGLYGYSDWRLPNLKELASIIERQCIGLTINNVSFPGTKESEYWTNTHRLGSTDVRVVNFNGGAVANSVSLDNLLYFRLVRDN